MTNPGRLSPYSSSVASVVGLNPLLINTSPSPRKALTTELIGCYCVQLPTFDHQSDLLFLSISSIPILRLLDPRSKCGSKQCTVNLAGGTECVVSAISVVVHRVINAFGGLAQLLWHS